VGRAAAARHAIELNADFGEGFGVFPAPAQVWRAAYERGGPLMPDGDGGAASVDAYMRLVTTVNLACGFHAGDPLLIKGYVAAAVANGCTIGAHVSFPDLAGFGNRYMELTPADLKAVVQYQIGALAGLAATHGAGLDHVKAHGVLYNRSMDDGDLARSFCEAVAEYDGGLPVYGLPDSAVEAAATAIGQPFRREAYSDRAYHDTGRLVDRAHPDAMILDAEAVARRVVAMAVDGVVESIEGPAVAIAPQTVSFHADSPGAQHMLESTVSALAAAGVAVEGVMMPPATRPILRQGARRP